jgi:hypothetical protein
MDPRRALLVRGPISNSWPQDGDTFHLDDGLPPNVTDSDVMPSGASVEVGPGRHSCTAAWTPA